MTGQEQQYVRQLEQAVLKAECVMADWECARRKGYIRDAQRVVFAAANIIRKVRREGEEQPQR